MEFIEPGSAGERAAMAAAKQTRDTPGGKPAQRSRHCFHNTCFRAIREHCSKATRATIEFFKDQSAKFISGGAPYRIEIHFTTVNFLVLCSIIVAFLDQFMYAFLPTSADKGVRITIL